VVVGELSDNYTVEGMALTVRSRAEILEKYESGERNFQGTELPEGSSFAGHVLADCDFRNSWLFGTNFNRADLRKVCFDESNLKCCDFRGANLQGASICESVICGSNFEGANVDGVCTEGTTWYGANVTELQVLAEFRK
jgi:uncharacterized protein YjbI with pentapeptide repeats